MNNYFSCPRPLNNTGSYPIHLAAWKGDIEVARTLIERGPSQANVDAQSHCEETALHLAAQYGHREVRGGRTGVD